MKNGEKKKENHLRKIGVKNQIDHARREVNAAKGKLKSDQKKLEIDESKMNEGGFYEGMPGVFLDAEGNRRLFEIGLSPEGDVLTRYGAHPYQVTVCLAHSMENNAMTRQIIFGAYRKVEKKFAKERRKKRRRDLWIAFITFITIGLYKPNPSKPRAPKQEGPKTSELSDEEYQARLDKLKEEEQKEIDQDQRMDDVDMN